MTAAIPTRSSEILNGIRQSWLEWNGPNRPDSCSVLILHGIFQNAEGMLGLAEHLARYHRVVVPDLRGRGESERPGQGYDPATMAADCTALIESTEMHRVVVIGRIDGGVIGYHLAHTRPDLVRGLVLAETLPEIDETRAARRLAMVRGIPPSFPTRDDAIAFYINVFGASEARAHNDLPHDMREVDGHYVWNHDLHVIEQLERAFAPRADWNVLNQVQAPTLVLRGQRGRLPMDVAQRVQAALPHAQLQTIFGSNHDVFMGAGSEQAYSALDMFLMRLNGD